MGSPIAIARQLLPGITSGVNTIDFTSYVSANATAAYILLRNNSGSARYDVGTRKTGSTTLPIGEMDASAWSGVAVPFQTGTKSGDLSLQNSNFDVIIAGEFGPDWFWFDEPVDLLPQVTDNADSLIDISAAITDPGGTISPPTATGAWIHAQGPGASGDSYEYNNGNNATVAPRRQIREMFQHAVGTPGEEWTVYMENATGLWVSGICSGGVTWTADKYANDDAPVSTDGTYEDLLTLSGGEEGVFWDHLTDDAAGTFATQPKGSGYDLIWSTSKAGFRTHAFSFEAPGADNVVQGARTGAGAQWRFRRVGIIDPASTSTPLNPNASGHDHSADEPTVTPGAMLVSPDEAGHDHSADEPTVTPIVNLSVQLKVIDSNSDIANRTINWKAWTLANYNANTAPDVTGTDVSSAAGLLTIQVTGSTGVAWHCEGKDAADSQMFIGEYVSQ